MIGFFGKLPGSADFIAYHAGHKDIRELDGWWQRALNRMAERDEDWEARFDALPLCFFHYRASGGAWLMGAMSPSQDASGRRYPLLVFQRLAVSPVVEGSVGVHTLGETFAGQVRELLRDVMHCADPQQGQERLLTGIEALRPLDDSDLKLHRRLFARFLEDVRYGDLTRALASGFPDVSASRLTRDIQALRRQSAARHGQRGHVALPLPPERALKRPAADLWLHWLEHDNGAPGHISVIVDDFMRPTLVRFTRDDQEALRILAESAPEALGGWRLLGSGEPHAGPLDASHASTLGMGAYIAALSDDLKDDPGPQGARAGSDDTVFGDISKDESAPT
ncbi:type VI secretion system-associated protein TagF [Cobetia sp. MMG027]|uniref:type VI secretion system-associated protein TagF n=1 Tax=Cobetia sp. MMG027 TaxID=3021980 RepID=UPI0022FE4B8A|nr:type VI secretion system-associated protein TagF [Cobetia sp. MMG027]MDA5562443.1 type VI secretion system-associated protein TagF [Cobetia sp. MMG027]